MILAAVTVCVNFEDYLEQTLPYNRAHFDAYVVVASRATEALIDLCAAHDATLVETARFYEDGARFNKGKGINEGLRRIDPRAWTIHLDADIVLPPSLRARLEAAPLDVDTLYGCARQMCPSYAAWKRYQTTGLRGRGWEQPPPFRYVPSMRQSWGAPEEEAQGGILPLGFFQLFSISASCLAVPPPYPESSSDAGASDLAFALKWRRVELLERLEVIHLPSAGAAIDANWSGRTTAPFRDVEAPSIVVNPLGPCLPKVRPDLDGPFASVYESGAKAQEGRFCGGLAHGPWIERHENGQIEAQGRYRKGLPDGRWLQFAADGAPAAEHSYRNGRLHGKFTAWHRNGQRAATGRYRAGRLHGAMEEWHPTGARAFLGAYVAGRKHGPFTAWHADGARALQMSYHDDQPHGRYRMWYGRGAPMVNGAHWHGERHGWFVSWYDDGQKAAQTRFRNGRQIGSSAAWPRVSGEDARLIPRARFAALEVVDRIDADPVAIVRDGCVGFEGLVFDSERLYLIDRLFSLSFEALCRSSRGFRLSPRAGRAIVPALLDLRWPATWPIGDIHPHPRHQRALGADGPPYVQRFDKLATIVHRYSGSYYHWLVEAVPRLLDLRDLLATDRDVRLLVDYDFGGSFSNTWTGEYLEILGIDPARVIRYDPARIYRAEQLYVPGTVGDRRSLADSLQGIRRALLGARAESGPGPVVAVSRAHAACRRIRNWAPMIAALRRIVGYEVVDLDAEALTVREQMALFASARLIVGPHGAGLANMVFAAPGTPVVEIVSASHVQGTCFEEEARALGLSHQYLRGSISGLDDDFAVAVDEVVGRVAALLEGEATSLRVSRAS